MHMPHCVYPFICGQTEVIPIFIVNHTSMDIMNISTQVSVWVPVFNSLGYILRSRMAGSYGNHMVNVLRNYQNVVSLALTYFARMICWTSMVAPCLTKFSSGAYCSVDTECLLILINVCLSILINVILLLFLFCLLYCISEKSEFPSLFKFGNVFAMLKKKSQAVLWYFRSVWNQEVMQIWNENLIFWGFSAPR